MIIIITEKSALNMASELDNLVLLDLTFSQKSNRSTISHDDTEIVDNLCEGNCHLRF
jgi:hypothetical protein